MTKTYDVTCPDKPFCGEEFEVIDLDPATEEDCIECPHCGQEFDWEHDSATDKITLLLDEYDEADGLLLAGSDDDEEGEQDEDDEENDDEEGEPA